ncbi:erythromycin esterase family protein [Streptomyces sp. bgisy034]|uniref:erythromycin esterase family protein n=1 Tax=Streptomyces sp. bgisy034 TaxID=3413774 RepID=UPI003EB7C42C
MKQILDGVRIIGLGEATHGTREFFTLKHRLLEFLVTELGFSTLAMEASASAGPAVDAYVRRSVGDATKVLAGLGFWTWRTHEVLAVIEWMRDYNRGRRAADQVRFVGIDPQQCADSLTMLASFLRRVAPDRRIGLLAPLHVLATAYPGSRPDLQQQMVRDAEELLGFLHRHHPETADALRHARILVRAADLVTGARIHADPEKTVSANRDRYMAEAVREVLSDPSAKVALWAHNGHVTKGRRGGAVPALGQHLHAQYGDAYYALGLLFGTGSFRARRMWPGPWSRPRTSAVVTNRIGPPRPGMLESVLAQADPGDHLIDLRSAGEEPPDVRLWLNNPHDSRRFGAVVPRWSYRFSATPVAPAQDFDGLAYVSVSTGSRPFDLRAVCQG